jgi:hypothetical protein
LLTAAISFRIFIRHFRTCFFEARASDQGGAGEPAPLIICESRAVSGVLKFGDIDALCGLAFAAWWRSLTFELEPFAIDNTWMVEPELILAVMIALQPNVHLIKTANQLQGMTKITAIHIAKAVIPAPRLERLVSWRIAASLWSRTMNAVNLVRRFGKGFNDDDSIMPSLAVIGFQLGPCRSRLLSLGNVGRSNIHAIDLRSGLRCGICGVLIIYLR